MIVVRLCMVLWQILTPHVWPGSTRPRSQCVGDMLLVQWCSELVFELTHSHTSTTAPARRWTSSYGLPAGAPAMRPSAATHMLTPGRLPMSHHKRAVRVRLPGCRPLECSYGALMPACCSCALIHACYCALMHACYCALIHACCCALRRGSGPATVAPHCAESWFSLGDVATPAIGHTSAVMVCRAAPTLAIAGRPRQPGVIPFCCDTRDLAEPKRWHAGGLDSGCTISLVGRPPSVATLSAVYAPPPALSSPPISSPLSLPLPSQHQV